MKPAFRLCKTKHLNGAMTGEGAKLFGGRWNSPGLPVVYAASSLSLATLEIMVHLEEAEVFYNCFSWLGLRIPPEIIESCEVDQLPSGWDAMEANIASRAVGDAWLRSMRTAVLAVPSVVTEGETNYLINPRHIDFGLIEVLPPQRFRPDARLRG